MWIGALSVNKRQGRSTHKKKYTSLVQTSWRGCLIRSHLFQFWEIFTFRSLEGVQFHSGFGLSHESKRLFPGVLWHKCGYQHLIGALPLRLKRVLLKVYFPTDKIFSLQSVVTKVFSSQDCIVRLFYQNMVMFNRRIRSLYYQNMSLLVSCGWKEPGAKCMGYLVTISKGKGW